MARIKFGAIVTDGRGKLGGHLLSKNGSCNTLGTMTRTKQKHNKYRQTQKNHFNAINKVWHTLTEEQIDGWRAIAPEFTKHNIFGDKYVPNPYQLFVYCNLNRLHGGYGVLSTAIFPIRPPQPKYNSILGGNNQVTYTIYGWLPKTNMQRIVWGTESKPKGYIYKESDYKLIPGVPFPGSSGAVLGANFASRVGHFHTPDWYRGKLYYVHISGMLSPVLNYYEPVDP